MKRLSIWLAAIVVVAFGSLLFLSTLYSDPLALKDDEDFVRTNAVMALFRIGRDSGEAVPALIEAIKDKRNRHLSPIFGFSVCQHAMKVLGRIGPGAKDAVPLLCECAGDSDE